MTSFDADQAAAGALAAVVHGDVDALARLAPSLQTLDDLTEFFRAFLLLGTMLVSECALLAGVSDEEMLQQLLVRHAERLELGRGSSD